MLAYINNVTLSNRTLTLTGTTPEDLAAQAVASDTSFRVCSDVDKFRVRQRFALLTLWFQQSGQPSWTVTSGWLSPNECSWHGIGCNLTKVEGLVDLQEAVTSLHLKNNNMFGTLPSDFGLLRGLVSLDFQGNYLAGTLPSTIGAWSHLEKFVVSNCDFNGVYRMLSEAGPMSPMYIWMKISLTVTSLRPLDNGRN
jgi:hypothetical protein